MLFLVNASDAEAYQPEGLRISLSDMPEPPCPYGHDDACEYAAPPLYSVNPFQSRDPHAHAHSHHIDAGDYDHHAHLESIAALNQQVLVRLAGSGDALRGTGNEPDGPGGDVSYAVTSDILGLPWIRDGVTDSEAVTGGWLSLLQDHNPSLVTSLVRMPFLQDHTPGDLQAIRTLTHDVKGNILELTANPQYATALATHPAFADGGGIDNTEAKDHRRYQHPIPGQGAQPTSTERISLTGSPVRVPSKKPRPPRDSTATHRPSPS